MVILMLLVVGFSVLAPTSATTNTALTVSWQAPADHSPNDRIVLALYQPDLKAFSSASSAGINSPGYPYGTVQLSASNPGEYICFYQLYSTQQYINSSNTFIVTQSVIIS